tara:strand:+ start:1157 stop:3154 length:1998 start_codon:yes stop_codon:yes gene_type:complete
MAMTREKYDKLTSADKEYYDFQAILSPEKRDKDTSADTAAYVNFRNQDKEKKKVAKEEDKPKRYGISATLPALQGLSLGTADEIIAGLSTGFGTLSDYGERLESIRGAEERFREAYPLQAAASEFGGGILGFGKAGQLLKGAKYGGKKLLPDIVTGGGATTRGGQVLRSAVPGAIGGATYGFTTGEGGAGSRGVDAAVGGGIGLVANPVLTGAVTGARPALGKIRDVLRRDEKIPVERITGDIIDRLSPQVVEESLERGKPLGAMPGVAEEIRPLIQTNQKAYDRFRSEIGDLERTKVNETFESIMEQLDEPNISAKKPDENYLDYTNRIVQEKKNVATKLYEEQQLDDIIDTEVKSVLDDILSDTRFGLLNSKSPIDGIRQKGNKNQIFTIEKDGTMSANDNVSVRSLEKLYIRLRDLKNPDDKTLIRDETDPILSKLKDLIDSNYKNLQGARANWQKAKEISDAQDNAFTLFTKTKENEFDTFLNKILESGEDELLDAARRGVIRKIYKENKTPTSLRSYFRGLTKDSADRRNLEKIFPDESFEEISKKLIDTEDFIKARGTLGDIGVTPGSRTSADIARREAILPDATKDARGFLRQFYDYFMKDSNLTDNQVEMLVDRLLDTVPKNVLNNANDPRYRSTILAYMQPFVTSITATQGSQRFN